MIDVLRVWQNLHNHNKYVVSPIHVHVGKKFSRAMKPDELAQWLLNTYGESYQDDIDKLKGKSLVKNKSNDYNHLFH